MNPFCKFKTIGENLHECITCGLTVKTTDPPEKIYAVCNQEDYDEYIRQLHEREKEYYSILNAVTKFQKAKNFLIAVYKHIKSGRKYCNKQQIKSRIKHCYSCALFNGVICTHEKCGCNVNDQDKFFNKLAWKSEQCPLNPPKWLAIPKD